MFPWVFLPPHISFNFNKLLTICWKLTQIKSKIKAYRKNEKIFCSRSKSFSTKIETYLISSIIPLKKINIYPQTQIFSILTKMSGVANQCSKYLRVRARASASEQLARSLALKFWLRSLARQKSSSTQLARSRSLATFFREVQLAARSLI